MFGAVKIYFDKLNAFLGIQMNTNIIFFSSAILLYALCASDKLASVITFSKLQSKLHLLLLNKYKYKILN